MHLGDFAAGDIIDFKFTTRRFSTGAPFTLAGTPAVSVYKGNSTTESTAGVTLTVDFDTRTGLNHVRITTASDGAFYANGSQFEIVITAGTVDSVSVVGEVVGRFTLKAEAVIADVAGVQADTDNIQTRLPAALVSGRIDASVGAMANNVMTAAATNADYVTELQAGLSTLDAAGVRTAVGLAAANLDTQLSTIDDFLDTEIAAIKAKTDNLPADPADASDIAASFTTVNGKLDTIDDFLDTEVAAIKAKTDNLPASPAATGDAMTLTTAGVDLILDDVVEGSYTLRQLVRGFAAALLGKASGLAGTTALFRDTGDTKNRISAQVDADGNRSSVTLDLT